VPGMITGPASVTLTGFDPTVATAAANIEPGSAALTVTGNAPALTGDANLASVVFLTSFDGVDGATSDTEFRGKALTFVGNAQIDTAQSVFGGSSLLLDGTGDYITTPDHADFDFAAGQFTVELWVRHNTGFSTNEAYIGQWGSTTAEQAWFLFLNSGSLTFRVQTAGGLINTTVAWTPTVGTWYALAVDRDATGKFRIYRDGVMVASSAAVGTAIQNGTGLLGIGRVPSLSTYDLQGWVDEIRVTKGVARYASDSGYTVPTAAFPRF
jgi:Concanavalin A-like lectin/glucanases superfamily